VRKAKNTYQPAEKDMVVWNTSVWSAGGAMARCGGDDKGCGRLVVELAFISEALEESSSTDAPSSENGSRPPRSLDIDINT
jgi:hypothetical protein